jgi:hypothetical protein
MREDLPLDKGLLEVCSAILVNKVGGAPENIFVS